LVKEVTSEKSLAGKTIVFTGASGHLGGGMFNHLLTCGATLINLGRREPVVPPEFAKQVHHVTVDFYDTDALIQTLESLNRDNQSIDTLVNNSFDFSTKTGFNHPSGRIENLTKETFLHGIESGLYWPLVCTQVIGKGMIERRKGNIINITSMYSSVVADYRMYEGRSAFNPIIYPIAKHGLLGMSRYIASFWSKYNIRCNCLSPGAFPKIASPVGQADAQSPNKVKDNDFISILESKCSLGRLGKPEDLLSAIEFLCSDKSSYMNGASLVVDGGWTVF